MGLKYLPFIPARWHKTDIREKHACGRAFFRENIAAVRDFSVDSGA